MEVPVWAVWLGGSTALYFVDRIYRNYRWSLLLKANAKLDTGNLEDCLEFADAASNRFPNDWQPLVTASCACLQLDEPEKALSFLSSAEKLVKKVPPELLQNRAVARAMLLDPSGALEDASLALKNGRTKTRLLTQTYVYVQLHRYTEALETCNEAMNLVPDSDCLLNRCWIYLGLNNLDAAKVDCTLAFQNLSSAAKPREVAFALQTNAIILSFDDMFSAAVEEQTRAMELVRDDPWMFINRAYYLSVAGDLDKALLDVDRADELAKSNYTRGYILSNRARISILKNELERARLLAEEAVSRCGRPAILCTRAATYMLTGRLVEAQRDLDNAEQLDPMHSEIYWWKGRLLDIQGNVEEADQEKQKALKWHYRPYF
ncbi:tetratricopeptide repeat protein [Candidatus Obscuribacterales bacterium]|nr:tetratricopeptide repeat protein [Candidatus Obscuribacterales bacterium]MBX3151424.1 tetratricopeptide repeat protein [Candidatus Obscuribacterales bacterium]